MLIETPWGCDPDHALEFNQQSFMKCKIEGASGRITYINVQEGSNLQAIVRTFPAFIGSSGAPRRMAPNPRPSNCAPNRSRGGAYFTTAMSYMFMLHTCDHDDHKTASPARPAQLIEVFTSIAPIIILLHVFYFLFNSFCYYKKREGICVDTTGS